MKKPKKMNKDQEHIETLRELIKAKDEETEGLKRALEHMTEEKDYFQDLCSTSIYNEYGE